MGRRTFPSVGRPWGRIARIGGAMAVCLATLLAATPAPSPSAPSPPIASSQPSTTPVPSAQMSVAPIGASATPVAGVRPLVFAYYYIWYTPASWRRAKIDLPQLGSYDSRDRAVIAQHLAWARGAGIDGLIVSWKHEDRLDLALSVLVDEATKADMKLILLYQGLDFNRLPLADSLVASDMTWFLDNYAGAAPFDVFGLPTIVWSGTWGYSESQLQRVRTAIGAPGRALLLGSERSADAYTSRAAFFDGDAYYWSSPDPMSTPGYPRRLDQLAAAVRLDAGRWIAPAAPGFDARLIGGTSVVPRRDGATLQAEWAGALGTAPDVLGIISWNEFSENSHIEPSQTWSDRYLGITRQLVDGLPATGSPTSTPSQPAPGASGASLAPKTAAPLDRVTPPVQTNVGGMAIGAAVVIALVLIGLAFRRRPVG